NTNTQSVSSSGEHGPGLLRRVPQRGDWRRIACSYPAADPGAVGEPPGIRRRESLRSLRQPPEATSLPDSKLLQALKFRHSSCEKRLRSWRRGNTKEPTDGSKRAHAIFGTLLQEAIYCFSKFPRHFGHVFQKAGVLRANTYIEGFRNSHLK